MTGAYTFKRFESQDGKARWNAPKGHWCAWYGSVMKTGARKHPQLFVLICCPLCGSHGTLPHRIDFAGGVYPSVMCIKKECKFHTKPTTLEDWDFGERSDTLEK